MQSKLQPISRATVLSVLSLFAANACILVDETDDDESGSGESSDTLDTTTTQGSTTGGTGDTSADSTMGTTADATGTTGDDATASDTGTGGETGADPNLPCGPAGDIHEDNDDPDSATPLTATDGKAQALAGVTSDDPDFFTLTPEKNDPIVATASYMVDAASAADLALEVRNTGGTPLAVDDAVRQGEAETMQVSWLAAAGEANHLAITSNDATCVAYELEVDLATCTDPHEDNDDADSAALLDFSRTNVPLSIHPDDADYFTFSVPKADPALIKVNHPLGTVDPGISVRVLDDMGQEVARATKDPNATDEVILLANWIPAESGAEFTAELVATGAGAACVEYELSFEQCTDDFEDNDSLDSAAMLPVGTHQATISDIDIDYYTLQDPPEAGECVVTYTATTGEDMSLILYQDGSAQAISSHFEDKIEDTEVMTVSWDASHQRPLSLWVQPTDPRCTSYTIDCHAL